MVAKLFQPVRYRSTRTAVSDSGYQNEVSLGISPRPSDRFLRPTQYPSTVIMTVVATQTVFDLPESLSELSLEPTHHNRALLAAKTLKGTSPWRLGTGSLPRSLGKRQVLVRNTAVGLTPYDWQSVAYGFGIGHEPKVQGRDGAGVIVSVGDEVNEFKADDRVGHHGISRKCCPD